MALSRRTGQRFQASIWPGFVDAMTGLLLVLMFLLTIFMVVQSVLSDTISGQETELNQLSSEVAALAQALGMEERESADLVAQLGALNTTLDETRAQSDAQTQQIATLTQERADQEAALAERSAAITAFEAQVAGLIADRSAALAQIQALEGAQTELLSQQEALNVALTQMRDEVDDKAQLARLAATRTEALQALIADLRARNASVQGDLQAAQTALSEEETARLTDAAAAEALRARLETAETELTAMTLSLDQQRQEAEDTLTLLAAAQVARKQLEEDLSVVNSRADATDETLSNLQSQLQAALASQAATEQELTVTMSLAEQRAVLLAQANEVLSGEEAASADSQRQTALLNQQVAALRGQLGELQNLLDAAQTREAKSEVQIETLGAQLNTALAQVAVEERRRRALEEAENARLEAEQLALQQQQARLEAESERLAAENTELETVNTELETEAEALARYRSEFFGRLRDVLGKQDGIRIEGDRFVFASEVLFDQGQADLSLDGQNEVAKVADILRSVASDIPPEINWIIRIDGHTDNVPLSGRGVFTDNWELSQARALSVLRYMVAELGIRPDRVSANGFGEFQPINRADTDAARAQNRRIELKFTEK